MGVNGLLRVNRGGIVWSTLTRKWDLKLMSYVEIRDHALWLKHIHGNEPLKAELESLAGGELVELEINDFRGMWKKMDDGKDGRPTQGIKAIAKAREHWHGLQSQRGELATILKAERKPDLLSIVSNNA